MNDNAVIKVTGLRKSYGSLQAVAGIDLVVEEGEVFALLGPNGAGKTTIVEILEGFRHRDAGDVRVLGRNPSRADRRLKEQIGIVLQSTGIDPYLTVAETIELFRGFYPRPRPLEEIIEVVGLAEKSDVRVTKLSGGQQRRLDVGIALAGDPKLLFLDEPTTGFDPGARRNAWEMVRNLAALGKTVFLTTHYMDEAQYLANRVAIISRGKIIEEGSPDTLGGRSTAATLIRFTLPPDATDMPSELQAQVKAVQEHLELSTTEPAETLYRLTYWALQSGVGLAGLEVIRPSLEDVYLELTGRDAPAGGTE